MIGQGSNNAPSPSLVIPYFLVSGFSWLVGLILLFIFPSTLMDFYFSPKLLSVTHIVSLGFISFVIFGALYQLMPVIFLTKLFSERLGKLSFWLFLLGTIGIASSFWLNRLDFPLLISGIFLALGTITFMINLIGTIYKSKENRVSKLFILTSGFWFTITVIIGFLLVLNFSYPFIPGSHLEWLKLHAHFGMFGWFLLLIIGASSVLIPMFLLVHKFKKRLLYTAYILINSGLISGFVLNILNTKEFLFFSYVLTGLGILSYILFILNIYLKRIRKNLDAGMKKTMVSFILLLVPIVLSGIFIATKNNPLQIDLSVTYLATFIVGFIATLIMGQFYKTLPFIVWLKVYKPFIGKIKTPLPKDLYSLKILIWQSRTHIAGFLVMSTALLYHDTFVFKIGIGLMLVGAILFLGNLLKIVLHIKKEL